MTTSQRDDVADTVDAMLTSRLANASESVDRGAWDALVEAGMTHIVLPEHLGGGDGELSQAAAVVRTAAYHAIAAPVSQCCIQAGLLLKAAGLSAPAGMVTSARSACLEVSSSGDEWLVNGVLPRVPYGGAADSVVALVETAGTWLVMAIPRPAATVHHHQNIAGEPRDDLRFTDAAVPAEAVAEVPVTLVEEFELWIGLSQLFALAGAAERVQQMTVQHIGVREQFGRPLSRFQVIQHSVAGLAGEVTSLSVGAEAALLSVQGASPYRRLAVASAVLNASRAADHVARVAHQLHGAIGTTEEHSLHRWTRRLWAWRHEEPLDQRWASIMEECILQRDSVPLWVQIVGEWEVSNA